MDRLIRILSHKRPAGSATEQLLREELLGKYNPVIIEGNHVVTVLKADGTTSPVLFSCHTDTVHSHFGTQRLFTDADFNMIALDEDPLPPAKTWVPGTVYVPRDRGCLGADDGAGWWLLMEMMDAKVPGTYVFHHSEERGGIGSRDFASKQPDILKGFKYAVAFDRKGTGDIIQHQRGGQCCSDEFVTALSQAFSKANPRLDYKAASGTFTDTANYTRLIPECTNISCGYYNEHTENEWLDVNHLKRLRDALIVIEWDTLPVVRDPAKVETYKSFNPYVWVDDYPSSKKKPKKGKWVDNEWIPNPKYAPQLQLEDFEYDPPAPLKATKDMTIGELEDYVFNYPEDAAEELYNFLHPTQEVKNEQGN